MIIEIFSFATATTLFLILGLVMLTGRRNNTPKKMLALASLASALWSGAVTYQAINGGLLSFTLLLEFLRSMAWFIFLLVMLRTAYQSSQKVTQKFRMAFTGISIFFIGMMLLALYRISGGSVFEFIAGNDVLIGHLMISIGGLVIVEQLYRSTSEDHRWALKYLWIAIGSMFAYDFYLYSDALLFQRIDNELWNARGFIHAMVVPIIGIAIRREMQWSLGKDSIDIFVSRRIVFHTTTLLGAGIYMVIIGIGGYYVREEGGSWGIVAQATFIFASILILAILLFSGKIRARVKVFIDKHFFHYKYDYREEWLRITNTLSAGEGRSRLHERAIRSLAQIIDSPAGMLWMRRENNRYEQDESWNMDTISSREPEDSSFIHFLREQQFVISIDEFKKNPEVYTRLSKLQIPAWLDNIEDAWLIVPLILNDALLGFIILTHSPSRLPYFNWEDTDLLKTAARQAASHLSQYETSQELAGAKRFEEVNQLSSFIMHDLKNMIGQLSLVVSNAAKHKHNPLFMEDAISTVDNSVSKMNKLLSKLRGEEWANSIAPFNLCELLEEIVQSRSQTGVLPIPILNYQTAEIFITADRDRTLANMGHIIQNAQDATQDDGKIIIRLKKKNQLAIIEVEDNGSGMDSEFIRERLFQPFESTKGTMGIGVFQVREFVNKLGGDFDVDSILGQGTTFRLIIPITYQDNVIKHPTVRLTHTVEGNK